MSPVAITLAVLLAAVIAFVSNRVPIGLVAIGVTLALWATGVVTVPEALAGFGDQTVVFVACLFVVSGALEATGVTTWVGQTVVGRAGGRHRPLVVGVCLLVAVLSALISVNGSVAALVPVAVVVAVRAGLSPSRLLIPLAFSAHAGSLLALTGSPVNIIVSDAAAAGGGEFTYFGFALAGGPLVVGTIAVILLLGPRLLPDRPAANLPPDLTGHLLRLRDRYRLSPDSARIDATTGVVEVVVPPGSALVGSHLFVGMTTPRADLVVLGVQRGGEDLEGTDAQLRAGDILLLRGSWDALVEGISPPDLLAVDDPDRLRRAVPFGRGARRGIIILVLLVVLLATGLVPPAILGLFAAASVVLAGVLTPPEAYRAVSWTTVVLIAGMIPLATAFTKTGTADLVARLLLDLGAGNSPYLALAAICLLTALLGQLISNAATVLIMVPVAVALANDLQVSQLPFLMALAVSAAAAFLTPVATPANMMILEPGGYRFGDYWKLGLPLLAMYLVVAIAWVPVVWPF